MFILELGLFIGALFLVWVSSEMIIEGIERISKRADISSFSASFFILGILTCIPELSIGINSLIRHEPEIYMGDLIGGSMVLFIFIIPLLAIFGNGIKLSHYLSQSNLIMSLFVVITPALFTLDGSISRIGGIFMVVLYILLFFFMHRGKNIIEKIKRLMPYNRKGMYRDLLVIVGGVILLSFSSHILVDKTVSFANLLRISPYIISLLVLSVGTNLPEMFIAIKAVMKDRGEIALGDYVGSAVTNTLLFGVFTLINGHYVLKNGQFLLTFFLFLTGLVLFFAFSRSSNDLSRKEGLILIMLYFVFLVLEVLL